VNLIEYFLILQWVEDKTKAKARSRQKEKQNSSRIPLQKNTDWNSSRAEDFKSDKESKVNQKGQGKEW